MKVVYNGVTIEYASITNWEETAEYDESGMNLVANKITLTIEGSVFPLFTRGGAYRLGGETTNVSLDNYDAEAILPSNTTSFGFRLNYCLRQLSVPRKKFEMYSPITKVRYFEAYPFDSEKEIAKLNARQRRNLDVNGGPKPRSVSVLQTCNEFARISFTIEITKIRCLAGEVGGEGSAEKLGFDPAKGHVVSNRFWTDETIDANFYTTRTFTGKLRISSPLKTVHYYRDLYYPPLEDGFRRDSVRFSESQDGLSLSYVVTDKQIRCAAPWPATSYSGNCSFSITNQSVMTVGFQLSMVGRPDAPKKALLQRCIEAFLNKTRQFNKNGCSTITQSFNVAENIGDPPSVTLNAKLLLTVNTSTKITPSEDIAQFSLPTLDAIGEPPEWGDIKIGDNDPIEYRRIRSDKPNPYGYDVYYVFEDENYGVPTSNSGTGNASPTPSENTTESSETTETEDEEDDDTDEQLGGLGASSPAVHGFIKCMATAPCVVQSSRYVQDASIAAEIEEARTTKVVKKKEEEEDVEPGAPVDSGAQEDAIDFPYTFYKSDISYYTDYSRIVLPKARYVATSNSSSNSSNDSGTSGSASGSGSGSGSGSDSGAEQAIYDGGEAETPVVDYTTFSIMELKQALSSKEEELASWESIRDADEQAEMTDQVAMDEAKIAALKEVISTIKKELDSRTSVRVVQVAQPIPKARVVIEAERFGRLPEMPDPDEIVMTTGDDPITFTCLKAETQLCDPRAATNTTDSVSYYVIGTYEYAMSRAYKKGDEVWLLQNPTFRDACYYPTIIEDGVAHEDVSALKTMYLGTQLNHSVYEGPTIETTEDFDPGEITA